MHGLKWSWMYLGLGSREVGERHEVGVGGGGRRAGGRIRGVKQSSHQLHSPEKCSCENKRILVQLKPCNIGN